MRRRCTEPAAVAAIAAALLAAASAAGEEPELGELIDAGIALTLEGDTTGARATWRTLRTRYPDHPAAPVFETYTLWSLQVADTHDTRYDDALNSAIDESVRLASARVEADESDARAHFYLGHSYFQRARLRGLRSRLLSAAAASEYAREHLEQALALDPQLADAKFSLALYYYYAGKLPQMVRWLSWLPFIPQGDAPTGLRYLEDVRRDGHHFRWDAAFSLMNIYTFHEPDTERADEIAGVLLERYPNNTLLRSEYTELLIEMCRYEAALNEALRIEQQATEQPALREVAPLHRARAQLYLGQPGRAWASLAPFGGDGPARPHWASAWVLLTRGQILDALAQRDEARDYYRQVAALRPPKGSDRAERAARAALEQPFSPRQPRCALTAETGS